MNMYIYIYMCVCVYIYKKRGRAHSREREGRKHVRAHRALQQLPLNFEHQVLLNFDQSRRSPLPCVIDASLTCTGVPRS